MVQFWNDLGTAGHLAIYLGLLSIASVLVNWMASKSGWVGTVGGLLVKLVDFFSANLKHK